MLALVSTPWDLTEIIEGTVVSLSFILAPLGWRMEIHARAARRQREAHHAEVMAVHAEHAERLKLIQGHLAGRHQA